MARKKIEVNLPSFFKEDQDAPCLMLISESVSGGNPLYTITCTKCGSSSTSLTYPYSIAKCSACGQSVFETLYSVGNRRNCSFADAKVEDDKVKFVLANGEYSPDFQKMHCTPRLWGEIDLEEMLVNDGSGKVLHKLPNRELYNVRRYFTCDNTEILKNAFGCDWYELMEIHQTAKEAKKTASPKTASVQIAEQIIKKVPALSASDVTWEHKLLVFESRPGYRKDVIYCPKLNSFGEFEDKTPDGSEEAKNCPCCGEEFRSHTRTRKVKTLLVDDKVGFLTYEQEQEISKTGGNYAIKQTFNEVSLLVYDEKKKYCWEKRNWYSSSGKVVQWEPSRRQPCWWCGEGFDRPISEVADIVRKSCLKYSGLAEMIEGLEDNGTNLSHVIDYMKSYYQEPGIKLLYLSGLTELVRTIPLVSKGHVLPNPKATKPADLLGINKPQLKILIELNPTWDNAIEIIKLFKLDENLPVEDLKRILEAFSSRWGQKFSAANFERLKKEYGIPVDKAFKYIVNTKSFQCIPEDESLNLWLDYLQMAQTLGYRMNNKHTVYPQSLKLEHDKAQYASQAIKTNSNEFLDRIAENKNLEYTFDKLAVILPSCPTDLVDEGRELKHCCGSYVQPFSDGKTVVMFIRYKESIKEPFYTVKLNDGKIFEVAGYCNKKPDEKDVLEFIEHWSKFKGLAIAC